MPNPIEQISDILGAPEGWLDDSRAIPDPLGEWFRHVGTSLSDEDYEAGIVAIGQHDQLRRTLPTDHSAEAEQAAANGKYEIANVPRADADCGATVRHQMFIRTQDGNLVGHCTGCAWWSLSMGADESARVSIRASFTARHMEEVKA